MRGKLGVLGAYLFLLNSSLGCQPAPERTVPPWPQWALEHWVWEDESTQQSAEELVDGYLDRDIPVGAIIIDSPWATGYSTFQWDTQLFPAPKAMVDGFHDNDVRVFVWTVPAINVDEVELYAYAAERGYFMQTSAEGGPGVVDWWKGRGSLIDYFNPEAVAWWHGLVDDTLALDIDGWKCDGLDYSAFLTPYSPGLGKTVTRLEYSHAYYRDFFDYTRQQLGPDRLITARPVDNYGAEIGGEGVSFAPVDITWAGWVGDQDPDFSGLRAALNNMYHSAAMGYVNFGSDIGGYRSDGTVLGRDKISFIRWAQLGSMNPVMENGGAGEHRPWKFDADTEAVYRRYTQLHHAMIPYLMEQGAIRYANGQSLMQFFSDETYAYQLGDDVFVAPILEDVYEMDIAFPAQGDWVYLFDTNQTYAGGTTTRWVGDLDTYPIYTRAGSSVGDTLRAALAY